MCIRDSVLEACIFSGELNGDVIIGKLCFLNPLHIVVFTHIIERAGQNLSLIHICFCSMESKGRIMRCWKKMRKAH